MPRPAREVPGKTRAALRRILLTGLIALCAAAILTEILLIEDLVRLYTNLMNLLDLLNEA